MQMATILALTLATERLSPGAPVVWGRSSRIRITSCRIVWSGVPSAPPHRRYRHSN